MAWALGGLSAGIAIAGAGLAAALRRGVLGSPYPPRVVAPAQPSHRGRTIIATWVLAWAAAAAIGGGGALAVVEMGLFDATAATPHYPIVGWAAHRAFISSVKRRAGAMTAPTFTPAEVMAGFRQYEHDCVMCHGGPGVPRGDFTLGMTPTPPFVIDAARRWTPAQLYWILAEGVKMTAMPAWRASRTDVEVWDDVAFLEALPYISPAQYAAMRAQERGPSGAEGGPARPSL